MDKLDRQPWELHKRVLPQHTDHAGVMWHGAYLSWLEEARVEALQQVGLPYKELTIVGFEMPVVSLQINYLRALLHGEEVFVESFAMPRKGARWPWQSKFLSSGGVIAAEAKVELVLISKASSGPRLLRHPPDHIASALLRLQYGPESID